ncbi:MAG: DUF4374 domain-containing protein [Tannerella sp.]|jgi:hypothetical protein|nr:DUF4374 domain-containing protein [Tannerella sp.]
MNIGNFIQKTLVAGMVCCAAQLYVSCGDNGDTPTPEKEKTGAFMLSVTGESTEYLLQATDISQGEVSIATNSKTLEQAGYTWVFNRTPSVAVGLIYQQGDPGIGLGYKIDDAGSLQEIGQFQISSRFTSYGFFDRYALTSVGGQTPVDAQGNALVDAAGNPRTDGVTFNFIDLNSGLALQEKTITTLNITGNGEQATLSGIVDTGNGEFLTGLVASQPRDPDATGGASSGRVTYPDSVWVAAFDAGLNLKRIYRDDRISYSSGRFRSQYYSQIGKAGDGSIYVFSGSFESSTSRPCGALKINSGATTFDASYYFNIEEKTDGYRFRKVWHVADHCFLLEMYNDPTVSAIATATQYGIVDMAARTFKWVTGIPAKDQITGTGLPAAHGGKMYFPITAEGANPALYIIDPATAAAVKGLSVSGATSINAVGILTAE